MMFSPLAAAPPPPPPLPRSPFALPARLRPPLTRPPSRVPTLTTRRRLCRSRYPRFIVAVSILVSRIAVELGCSTFGELGEALGGHRGKMLLRGTQVLNNALFMPVALILSAEALRQIGLISAGCIATPPPETGACEFWNCNINSLLLLIGLAWPILLVARDVGHLGFVSVLSIGVIVVQGLILILYAIYVPPYGMNIEPYRAFGARCAATARPPARPLRGWVPLPPFPVRRPLPPPLAAPVAPPSPLPLCACDLLNPPTPPLFSPRCRSGSPSWWEEVSAIGTFLYSFCPMFLAVEVASGMEQPRDISRALSYSFLFNQAMYIPVGLIVVAFWGGEVTDPSTMAMAEGAGALIANGILLFCTFVDYAIVGALVNKELQVSIMPTFDRKCSWHNMPIWLVLTLPSLLFSLMLALFVPKLDALKGLLTAFCVPSAMLFGPAGLILHRMRRGPLTAAAAADAALATVNSTSTTNRVMLMSGFYIGLILLVAILAQTIHNIVFDTEYGGPYFCDMVAA